MLSDRRTVDGIYQIYHRFVPEDALIMPSFNSGARRQGARGHVSTAPV